MQEELKKAAAMTEAEIKAEFNRLYRLKALKACLSVTLNGCNGIGSADREDAEQEAWLKVYNAIGKFDPAKGKAETYYCNVIRNAVRSFVRKLPKQTPVPIDTVCVMGEIADAEDAEVREALTSPELTEDPLAEIADAEAWEAAFGTLEGVARAVAIRIRNGATKADICDGPGAMCTRHRYTSEILPEIMKALEKSGIL